MRFVYAFVIVLVAFSCMVYELALAQTSSILLGNALVNYSVTICIYLAALGLGSLLFSRFQAAGHGRQLINTEIVLSYLGPTAPVLALLAEFGLRHVAEPGSGLYYGSLQAVIYSLVLVVGLLSGFELPILMSLGETHFRMRSGAVLGLDYAGTLLAVAIFPTLGLAVLGLFGTAALAGIGSWAGAAMTVAAMPRSQWSRGQVAALVPSFLLIILMLVFESKLRHFIAGSVYLAGAQ